VRLDEPAWWYAPEIRPAAHLLAPIAAIYARAAEWRYRRGSPYRSRLPVVCVGNFTAGGTGKTPLALLIAHELVRIGERPVFLTRGYGGKDAGPHVVDARTGTAAQVGDEALLLAEAAPTIVSHDRAKGARAAQHLQGRPTVIVMDDGLQNPALAKDVSIAVVDGRRGLGNGRVLPAGPLRAPLAFQLGLVDAIVVNDRSHGEAQTDLAASLRCVFRGPVFTARVAPEGDLAWLAASPVVAFAGIGDPRQFFAMLEQRGARVLDAIAFPDHHAFSEQDASRLLAAADRSGARLLTTRKDLARLRGLGGERGRLRERAHAVAIRLVLGEPDAGKLHDLLTCAVQSGRQ